MNFFSKNFQEDIGPTWFYRGILSKLQETGHSKFV